MQLKFLTFCLFLTLGFNAIGQKDQNQIYTKWQLLKSVQFQNGESLKVVTDLNEWNDGYSRSNLPMVFIDSTGNYFYNYAALIDEGKIVPSGREVPHIDHFTQIKLSDFSNFKLNDLESLLRSKVSIEFAGNKWSEFHNDGMCFWVSDKYDDDEEFANIIVIDEYGNKLRAEYKQSGFMVLTHESSINSQKKKPSLRETEERLNCKCGEIHRMNDEFGNEFVGQQIKKKYKKNRSNSTWFDWQIISQQSGGWVFEYLVTATCFEEYIVKLKTGNTVIWQMDYLKQDIDNRGLALLHMDYPDHFVVKLDLTNVHEEIERAKREKKSIRIEILGKVNGVSCAHKYTSPKLILSKCN